MVVREVLGADKSAVLILAVEVAVLVLSLSRDHLSVWLPEAVAVVDLDTTTSKIQENLVEYILAQLHRFMQ
jgi:hypothetical protein